MSTWTYFANLTLPESPVIADVTARALLILNLRRIHAKGRSRQLVNPVLLLDPASATATAHRFGLAGMKFDLDDILTAADSGRHRLSEDHVTEYSAPVLVETGGHGQSHEDNRDMVSTRELAVA